VIGCLALVVAGGIGFMLLRDKLQVATSISTTTHFSDEVTGLSLDYNNQLAISSSLSPQNAKDKLLLRLTDKGGTARPFLLTVRYERDRSKPAASTKQSLIDYLQGAAELALPQKPGYKQESAKRVTVDGQEAIEFIFSYTGNQQTPAKQRLTIIPLDNDRAAYIAQQSKTEDYDALARSVFDPLQASIKL